MPAAAFHCRESAASPFNLEWTWAGSPTPEGVSGVAGSAAAESSQAVLLQPPQAPGWAWAHGEIVEDRCPFGLGSINLLLNFALFSFSSSRLGRLSLVPCCDWLVSSVRSHSTAVSKRTACWQTLPVLLPTSVDSRLAGHLAELCPSQKPSLPSQFSTYRGQVAKRLGGLQGFIFCRQTVPRAELQPWKVSR